MRIPTSPLMGLVLLASIASPAWANKTQAQEAPNQCPICRTANDQQASYGQKAAATLVRGMTNTALGWTELLIQPASEVNAKGRLLVGIGKGISYAVTRTALGVGELFTFWTPKGTKGYPILIENCPVCLQVRPPTQAATRPKPDAAKSTPSTGKPAGPSTR